MDFFYTILLAILTFTHSTFGGFLQRDAFAGLITPNNNNYGRIASYSSPIIANPVAATYSTRYTAYTAVPLAASVGTSPLVPRYAAGGLVRVFAAPSLLKHSGLSSPLTRQSVSAYAAVPIAGYRASFGGPSLRNYGVTLRSFPAAFSNHPILATSGFDEYADSVVVNAQRTFGDFDNESSLTAWSE